MSHSQTNVPPAHSDVPYAESNPSTDGNEASAKKIGPPLKGTGLPLKKSALR